MMMIDPGSVRATVEAVIRDADGWNTSSALPKVPDTGVAPEVAMVRRIAGVWHSHGGR